jgi:hypothetical protein
LQNAHFPVVEGRVVCNGIGVHNKAVISDNGDVSRLRRRKDFGERIAVYSGDYQNLGSVGNHVFDLRDLYGDFVFAAELQVYNITHVS